MSRKGRVTYLLKCMEVCQVAMWCNATLQTVTPAIQGLNLSRIFFSFSFFLSLSSLFPLEFDFLCFFFFFFFLSSFFNSAAARQASVKLYNLVFFFLCIIYKYMSLCQRHYKQLQQFHSCGIAD